MGLHFRVIQLSMLRIKGKTDCLDNMHNYSGWPYIFIFMALLEVFENLRLV